MKKVLFSGIQPSGIIHIGNLFGAIEQWKILQDQYDSIFSVVDLHAMTVFQEPQILKENVFNTAKTLISLGIGGKNSALFVQSAVPAHLELYWILNTITKVSELELMTQFKDKSRRQGKGGAFAGLLNYPVLMASDVLLYNAEVVPVGEDQRQHLELTREVARRFNDLYGETFRLPKALIQEEGSKIMGLDDPTKKMSKSASSSLNYIALTDSPKDIENKIKKSVTDSGSDIKYDPIKKPGISNLLIILSQIKQIVISDLEKDFKGQSYGTLKSEVSSALITFLSDFQEKYEEIRDKEVTDILEEGKEKAEKIAKENIEKIYEKVGLK